MSFALFIEQTVNALQLGMLLFLVAVGITLVFGVMDVINLSHGSFVMLGAYVAAAAASAFGSYLLAIPIALVALALLSIAVELLVLRHLYGRGHLDQVLATFGLILIFNESVVMLFGKEPLFLATPAALSNAIELVPGLTYPSYRLAITGVAIAIGLGLHVLITRSKLGMLIRAGADKREMVEILGVNIRRLFTVVFMIGSVLGGIAGLMLGPIVAVRTGMGEPILIMALVCVIVGGLGSIKGALIGSLLVGAADTFGRVLLPQMLGAGTGQAVANMSIYVLMAIILVWRPSGFVGARA